MPVGEGAVVSTARTPRGAVDALRRVEHCGLNFEPIDIVRAAAVPSWRVDHRSCALPPERPGPPAPGGPFATARQVLIDYEFADPRLVRAVYDAATPFDGRTMLLVGRFFGLHFFMGVRVGDVVDGPAEEGGRPIHRFAWNYRTLEGHLEQGEMTYELTKWVDTGAIDFRIRAYSRRGPIKSPIVRLGFALFGRWEQRRFYDRSLDRLQAIVVERAATVDAR